VTSFLSYPRARERGGTRARVRSELHAFTLHHGQRHLAVIGIGAGRHDLFQHAVRRVLVAHDRDFAILDVLLSRAGQHRVGLALQRFLQRLNHRFLGVDHVTDLGDGFAVHQQVFLGDHHHHARPRLLVRERHRNRDALGVGQDVHVGVVHQQEHREDHQHVDERHQRHVAGRFGAAMFTLAMTFDSSRSHVGASPTDTSGNSSP